MNNTLTYRNNWESDEYFVNEKKVSKLKEVMINGKKYSVTSGMVSKSYHDMGHEYHASSKHYFIRETVFGIELEFDLNKIVRQVKVEATKFSTR